MMPMNTNVETFDNEPGTTRYLSEAYGAGRERMENQ